MTEKQCPLPGLLHILDSAMTSLTSAGIVLVVVDGRRVPGTDVSRCTSIPKQHPAVGTANMDYRIPRSGPYREYWEYSTSVYGRVR
jgi:hypothetical protein